MQRRRAARGSPGSVGPRPAAALGAASSRCRERRLGLAPLLGGGLHCLDEALRLGVGRFVAVQSGVHGVRRVGATILVIGISSSSSAAAIALRRRVRVPNPATAAVSADHERGGAGRAHGRDLARRVRREKGAHAAHDGRCVIGAAQGMTGPSAMSAIRPIAPSPGDEIVCVTPVSE